MSFSTITGFSLLEILIALVILAICLLGIGSLESAAFKRIYAAYLHSIAANQILNMTERLQAGDQDCQTWISENTKLLPHSVSKCTGSKISLCWQIQKKEACLETKI